jgi:phosphopantothenoylcysteine decarboxylase
MARVLVGVTGSVAALKTPALFDRLRARGHRVKVVATAAACYFFDPLTIDPLYPPEGSGGSLRRNPESLILDEDEWPGRPGGQRYRRDDPVLHIELRRWADLFVIAPLDANTLAKLALGLCDNCLTCVWRAWDPARPVVLAPAMNTLMWQHPATARHLRQLAEDAGVRELPADADLDGLLQSINTQTVRLRFVPPQVKRLACEDVGVGALAELDEIVTVCESLLRQRIDD